jgi:aminoglycoside phosphotransferase (APT) family kinase protein
MMAQSFVEDLSTFVFSLRESDRPLISSPLQWTLLANGDADFHDNVIFFGFDEHQTEPVLVAKVPRLVENGRMVETEYDHLVELWNRVGTQAENYVPKAYALTTLQERPVLLLSYVSGEGLTRLANRSFWEDGGQVSRLARQAARALRELNHLTRSPVVAEEDFHDGFSEKAERFRALFPLRTDEEHVLTDLIKSVESGGAAASHKVLIQGDFWHGNMIRSQEAERLMLVDWQFARWSVDVSVDVYFFLLAGALSATGEAPVVQRAKEAFTRLSDWRSHVIPEYLATYGTPAGYSLLPQREGMLMCCVEKAVRSALEFGYSHPDDLMWRHLFTELLAWQDET